MATSPDAAAAVLGAAPNTSGAEEIESLREMAAALGFLITPMSAGELLTPPSAHPQKLSDMIKRAAWLKAAANAADAAQKSYKADYDKMRAIIAEQMTEEGVKSQSAGGATASFAKVDKLVYADESVTPEVILAAIKEAGLGFLVKTGYSYQSVQKYLKELAEHKPPLPVPEALARVARLESGYEVRLRPSGGE